MFHGITPPSPPSEEGRKKEGQQSFNKALFKNLFQLISDIDLIAEKISNTEYSNEELISILDDMQRNVKFVKGYTQQITKKNMNDSKVDSSSYHSKSAIDTFKKLLKEKNREDKIEDKINKKLDEYETVIISFREKIEERKDKTPEKPKSKTKSKSRFSIFTRKSSAKGGKKTRRNRKK